MANKIQFKRGEGAPAVGALDVGEPGFDLTNKKLYIGTGITETPILINKDLPSDYATQTFVVNKIAEAQLAGGDVDLSGFVSKDELNTLAAPAGYGYGGKAVALHSVRINTEEELTTKLEELYGVMKEKETKLVYWGGYPAGTTGQTWFGILTKSSTANGSVLAWSAYDSGELIRKVKFDGEWKAVMRYTTTDDLTLDKLGAAPAGYGYGGNAININIGDRVNNEDELTSALSVVYDQMIAPETKLVYWNGYPAAKDSTHGWFGILTKSSDRNGDIIAWSAYNEGSLIRKSKYSGSWQPLEWENPPMTAGEEYRTTERINGKIVFKMADDAGNVWYAFDDDGPWRSYSDLVGSNSIRNLVEELTIAGGIGSDKSEAGLGVDMNTDGPKASYVRTEPIPVMKGDVIKASNLNGAENYSLYLLYDGQMNLIDHLPGTKNADYHSVQKTVQQDGYVRFCQRKNALSTVKIELHEQVKGNLLPRKTLNILVIGNSFSQDSFAYLPPVLNEILHDYSITYGVAYSAGTELPEQVKWKINKEITKEEAAEGASIYYNFFNYWEPGATKWTRETKKTIEDVVARKKWDIIYLQPGGAQKNDGEIRTNIINPGRTILNWLQERNGGPFSLMVGNHLAVSDTSFVKICNGMLRAKQWLGIHDFIPIGTAIQNARTNADWAKLEGNGIGTAGAKTAPYVDKETGETKYKTPHPLLYKDCTHMQAGIPALIATYTIALKILECVGESHRGIYDSSFVPTDENCVAIGAGSESGGTKMTHGRSRGVTAENIKLAQEYAVLAVNNPTTVSNGSNLPADMPGGGGYTLTEEDKTELKAELTAHEHANVLDFGAVGDGVTDDTKAVEMAIATGKSVYFPAGTYLITSTLSITPDTSTRLYGDGAAKSIMRYEGDGYLFDINCRYNDAQPVIEGFDFVGTDTNTMLRASVPDRWGACFVLRNFKITNFNTVCMELVSAFQCVIENGVIRTSGKVKTSTHNGKQTLGNYSNCVTWTNVIFTRPTSESPHAACYFEFFNVKKFVFTECQFQFADVIFTNTGNVSDINCDNCWFEQNIAIYKFAKDKLERSDGEYGPIADPPITSNCYFTHIDSFDASTVTRNAAGEITAISERFEKLPGRDNVLVKLTKDESRNDISLIDTLKSGNEVIFSQPRCLDSTATSVDIGFPYTISSKKAYFNMPLNCVTYEKENSNFLAPNIFDILHKSTRSILFDIVFVATHYDGSFEVYGAKAMKLNGTLIALGQSTLRKPTGSTTAGTSVVKFKVVNPEDDDNNLPRLNFRIYDSSNTDLKALKLQMFVQFTFTDAN